MRQAIETKWLPPTNTKVARIVAPTGSGLRRTYSWDYEYDEATNHKVAAMALRDFLGWGGDWFGGATVKGFCFVDVTGLGHFKPPGGVHGDIK